MFLIRRYALFFAIAACFLVILTFLRKPSINPTERIDSVVIPLSSREDFLDPETGRLRWEQVPVAYPVRSVIPLPTAPPKQLPKVQYSFPLETSALRSQRRYRQQAVKDTFQRCWKSYRELAWMKDELAPISGSTADTFGGWAATLVDSLDTLWIMNMTAEFDMAAKAALDIDLGESTSNVINVFETTIRHLGGFLSAYDLSGDQRLLDKAKQFGDMLIVAFDTPNRMPITRWRPFRSIEVRPEADHSVLIAEVGSLSLEFTRLSQLTGDPKWYDATNRVTQMLDKQQSETLLPGMWPVTINAQDADFTHDSLFTLNAMSDSLYEYFPKMHALLGGVDPVYRKLYDGSMAAAVERLLWKPMTPDNADILISGQVRKYTEDSPAMVDSQGQHLGCFTGGMFALGSKLFDRPAHLDIAKKLVNGCIWTYKASPLGIMPEIFRMLPCIDNTDCTWNETEYMRAIPSDNLGVVGEELLKKKRLPKGFTHLVDSRYLLRPEAIESVFLLYRMTGEEYLLDAAWDMFTAITNATQTPLANAALSDMNPENGEAVQVDSMESFWMAETLKYFYLIFSEPDHINLDEYVFNTEAHPLKRRLPG